MEVHVSLSRSGKLVEQVYRQLKEAILDGRFRAGEPLPSTRELAARLSVSRNTVMSAFGRLVAEGFLSGRAGSGTFVNETSPAERRRAPAGRALVPRKIWSALTREPAHHPAAQFDYRVGAPDATLFPWDAWRGAVARQLRGRRPFVGPPPPDGEPTLRAAIARHIGLSRAVRASADDVLVCTGAHEAFDLITRVLVEPGACVAVEEPGYPSLRWGLEAHGARVVSVRVDEDGLDVQSLPDDARVVFVTPSHQFPLGVRMSLARRTALLAWSERNGAAIVEDDYDSEFRFGGRPVEPLQSLDRRGRVLYVGTFSKVLLPTLRVGFLVAPPSLMPTLRTAKRITDSYGPLEIHRALAEFIDEGLFARHLRRLLRAYGERRERLLSAVERHLGNLLVALPSSAGLHTALWCKDANVDVDAWAQRAMDARVAVESLNMYYAYRPRAGLVLGYGLIPASKIDEGIARLAASYPAPRRRAAAR